jgi:chromosome segregation ATPase
MAANSRSSPESAPPRTGSGLAPGVRLEISSGTNRPVVHEVSNTAFLVGSVPGCDLRLAGADLPPVICLVTRHSGGAAIRRLVPTQPVLVNGRAVTSADLADGDQVTLASVKIAVHVEPSLHETQIPQASMEEDTNRRLELETLARHLDTRQQELDDRTQELEADRVIWYRRREEIEQEVLSRSDSAARPALAKDLERRREELDQQQRDLEAGAEQLRRQQQEFAGLRQELAEIRQQLYDRYRKRRDRLAGLHEAVDRAARKVQENKRQIDTEWQRSLVRKQEDAARKAELDAQAAALEAARQLHQEQEQLLVNREKELTKLQAECQLREQSQSKEREALQKKQSQYQADLVRLDRLQATLDQRQQQLQERAREVDQRFEQLQRSGRELEEHATELDQWHDKLRREAEQLTRHKAEQEAANSQLAQRAAALEGQQAMLASLRTRLERMREELRREQQQLAEQQARVHESEAEAQRKLQEVQQKSSELDRDQQLREQERQKFEERRTALEAAVSQLRQVQDAVDLKEQELAERGRVLDERAAKQEAEVQQLQARSAEVAEIHQRLEADRQALRESQATLMQTEQTREALQEQLRRRADELTARQRTLAEQAHKLAENQAALEASRTELENERRQTEERLDRFKQEMDSRAKELERLQAEFAQRDEQLHLRVQRLKEAGRNLGNARKALHEERAQWLTSQKQAAAEAAQARDDLDNRQRELLRLEEQLPELELRAQGALERLAHAREQLREHLGELHSYARQSQDDIETLRGQVQVEAEQVRQQRLALQRARDEHRLGVAAFHQQLIEWQGQVADMKRTLAHDETRLERRHAKVEEQARQIDAGSVRLAQQAEELQQQERVVSERREEVQRHLDDMREWYRRKLREMSSTRGPGPPGNTKADAARGDRDILSLSDDLEPGDRKLGDLLRSLSLVDAETLASLFAEARRQHRSLRQALLAGGYLTLYQMALIEAGNLGGLVLGSFRVVDRLAVTAHEAVYRIFDPGRGQEAVLRHLAEAEMEDAMHPDEFRQRFRQAAAVVHPHVAATLEVLEIGARPAALQEWVTGLPSPEWPALAGIPGVWCRLVRDAVSGLQAAHQAGLVHGHLRPELLVLTGDGILKLCGLGEPPWLVPPPRAHGREDFAGDLADLGCIIDGWAKLGAGRKGPKAKPLPESLQTMVARLTSDDPAQRYPSAGALLEYLQEVTAGLSQSNDAWEQFLQHVREQNGEVSSLRQSA